VGTLVLPDQAAFLQAAQHVSNDSSADLEMVGQFRFDDAVLPEHQAAGDIILDDIIDSLPGRATLQSLVGFLRDNQAECLDVRADQRVVLV